MKKLHHGTGESDPVAYTCTCTAGEENGLVLLFYRYFRNTPTLPEQSFDVESLAAWQEDLTQRLSLGGKIRVADEGFNVTVGGTRESIQQYIEECCQHWSFQGLDLESDEERKAFFKPSPGCACVFGGKANVRVAAEITPMGVTGYVPGDWGAVVALTPEEFHHKCYEEDSLLLDVRNHYESKIGYFVDPMTGEPATRPGIRRFSQWPQFVKRSLNLEKQGQKESQLLGSSGGSNVIPAKKQIMTYCTGGIRCEKGVRWMQECLEQERGKREEVYTLQGGIAAYLTWMEREIGDGKKLPQDSLFKGRNYVFDARGSTGLSAETEPVSTCHICGVPADGLSKCQAKGCHLVLVLCSDCDENELWCCQSCHELDMEDVVGRIGPRPICFCEQEREASLWGPERTKPERTQGWKKARRKELDINIQIKTID